MVAQMSLHTSAEEEEGEVQRNFVMYEEVELLLLAQVLKAARFWSRCLSSQVAL
jgi:hypothetical protein